MTRLLGWLLILPGCILVVVRSFGVFRGTPWLDGVVTVVVLVCVYLRGRNDEFDS